MILDEISAGIPGDAPWTMLFADDLVIASSSRIEVEKTLEKWRVALENAGLKISRKKTEHLAMNAGPEIVRMDGYQLKKVTSFKYLGSRVNENATTEEDMLKRTQCGWMKWRDLTPMLCDKRMPLNVKSKLYITVVRPAMLYGAECWATKSVGIKKMEAAEMKMLRWTTGKTKLDKIPNTITRSKMKTAPIGEKIKTQRLRWFGHLERRDETHIGRIVEKMKIEGKDLRTTAEKMDGLHRPGLEVMRSQARGRLEQRSLENEDSHSGPQVIGINARKKKRPLNLNRPVRRLRVAR